MHTQSFCNPVGRRFDSGKSHCIAIQVMRVKYFYIFLGVVEIMGGGNSLWKLNSSQMCLGETDAALGFYCLFFNNCGNRASRGGTLSLFADQYIILEIRRS